MRAGNVSVVRKLIPVIGEYWTYGGFAFAAVLLLVLGALRESPSGTAMVGAGCALAGAGAARFADLDRERRGARKQAEEARKRDLDETRRLGYMALMSTGCRNYELAATLANALVHHQRAADVGDALRYLRVLAEGGPGDLDESLEWLNEQIFGITSALDDFGPVSPG